MYYLQCVCSFRHQGYHKQCCTILHRHSVPGHSVPGSSDNILVLKQLESMEIKLSSWTIHMLLITYYQFVSNLLNRIIMMIILLLWYWCCWIFNIIIVLSISYKVGRLKINQLHQNLHCCKQKAIFEGVYFQTSCHYILVIPAFKI